MVYIVYTILCLIWGSTWLAIKIGLDDAPPLWSAGLRFLIASIMLLLYNALRGIKYPREITTLMFIAFPGLFMYSLSYMLVYISEVYLDSALTAVLFASFPFFVAGFSILMFQEEKLSKIGWIGLAIGFLGIVVVFYDSLMQSEFIFLGAVLAVIGSAASGFGTVYVSSRLKSYDISMQTAVQMSLGTVVILLAALIFEPLMSFRITPASILSLLYLALFGSVVAFTGYYWLLKKIRTIVVAQIAFITPVLAVVLGNLVRNEVFSSFTAFGSVLILIGVFLVLRK